MKAPLLKLLACPACRADLTLETATWEDGECMEGVLRCPSCQNAWPVLRGVPRFVPAGSLPDDGQATAKNFGWQWRHFTQDDARYAEQFLGWIQPLRPEWFAGKRVLDAGCGKGRHCSLVAHWGAREVVAVDLSAAVDVAFDKSRQLPNVHVVQADLNRLPLKPAFDHAFSVGVLHHTSDPRGAFRALASAVKPGGHVSAWVYGAENNGWIARVIDPLRKHVSSRIPPSVLLHLSRLPALLLFALTRLVYAPVNALLPAVAARLFYNDYLRSLGRFGWIEHHTVVFDHLVAPTAHYVARPAFELWWRDVEAEDVVITWHNRNSWAGLGRLRDGTQTAAVVPREGRTKS